MSAGFDPYAVLGVARDASVEEIRSAFRRAVRREHPDTRDVKEGDEDAVRHVMAAYDILSDSAARAAYDARRVRDPDGCGFQIPVSSEGAQSPQRRVEEPCGPCRGRGVVVRSGPCPVCDATGSTVALDPGSATYERCRRCAGRRRVEIEERCAVCAGRGRLRATR